jgi:hypothetical protein
MKTLLIFAAGAVLAGSAFGQGNNISAPVVQRRTLPPLSPAQSEGSLQRGVRLGNPAQLFSPFAPAKYGSGSDFVTPHNDAPLRPRNGHLTTEAPGLRLLSFSF